MTYTYKYILAFIFITLLSACKQQVMEASSDASEKEPTGISISQNQFSSSKFELGKIEERSFSKVLNAIGSIHIPEKSKAVVSSLMSGKLGAIDIIEGQWVNKGEKLFTVTNPELINLQEEYLIANGQLEYLNEEYNRQIDLSKENISTKKDLLKARSALTTMQARHGALSKKLALYGVNTSNLHTSNLVSSLIVRAPISGYVSSIDVMQGMFIEPNHAALTLANTSHVFLELSVLEKDAFLLKKDQQLAFTMTGNHNKVYQAQVYLINKSINEKHMIKVHCKIEGETKDLLPGMYANAKIILDDYKASALPEGALVKMDETFYALTLKKREAENMMFDKVALKTGEIQNGYIELVDHSKSSSDFLIKGAYFLLQ